MHLPTKQSDAMNDVALRARNLSDIFLVDLPPCAPTLSFNESSDIFENQPATRLFKIETGQVFYRVRRKLVMVFDHGDLLGVARSMNLHEGVFTCSEGTSLIPYERDDLLAHAQQDDKRQKAWVNYLVCMQVFFQQGLASEIRSEFQPQAGFLHYQPGDIIIQQGDDADRVYTLLEGSADVICDNVKVGVVQLNEIFGAFAVFTRQPRIASVIATSHCTVLAVRKEEFVDLIDSQPQICLELIEEMAQQINQLNNRLLEKSR